MATITTTPYGTYTHGVPARFGPGYSRVDTWNGYLLDQPCIVTCASAQDDTPIFRGDYDAACACCWLGHCHTEASHTQSIARRSRP